jgi:zinc protease
MIKKSYLLILLLLPIFTGAQNKLPGNMFLHTLPNGLDVLVVEDNSVPLATIMMTFKAGAFTESESTNGLTGLYLNMLQKNNKDYTDFGYNAGGLGIVSRNALTTVEYGRFFFTLPKANTEQGLNFMNSAVRFATMDPEVLEKEKEIVNDELKQKESGPYFALAEETFHHLWGDLYSRKNPIGSHDVILSATPALMDSIKNKYFYPNNALLIIGGDVAHDNIFRLVEKKYGDWKSSSFDPFKKWPVPEFKPLIKSDYFIVESSLSKAPYITIDWQGPDTRNDIQSTYAADVFSYIVNQRSSKLNLALVQSGLAFSVNISYLTLKHVGPISLTITPNPSKIRECMDEVKKQIGLMNDDNYFTDDQIETAKRILEINQVREEDVTSSYVGTLSFWWASASLNYFLNYNDRLKKVSRADLKAYVSKYIKDKPYGAGLLINPDLKNQVNAETFFKPNN